MIEALFNILGLMLLIGAIVLVGLPIAIFSGICGGIASRRGSKKQEAESEKSDDPDYIIIEDRR